MLAADAPKITDWMQGWGSLLAVFTSLVAIIFTGMLLRHEIRARQRDESDRLTAQARLITVTVRKSAANGSAELSLCECRLVNHSAQPIFNVKIRPGSSLGRPDVFRLVDSKQSGDPSDSVHRSAVIDGSGKLEVAWEARVRPQDVFAIRVSFTDAIGNSWWLTDRGPRSLSTWNRQRGLLAAIAVCCCYLPLIQTVHRRYWRWRDNANRRIARCENPGIPDLWTSEDRYDSPSQSHHDNGDGNISTR